MDNFAVKTNSTLGTEVALPVDLAEKHFYGSHVWALDPLLSLSELFQRFHETLDLYESFSASWQREECKANLYVFVCAISCTVDDYLGEPPLNLLRIADRLPQLRVPLRYAQRVWNLGHFLADFLPKLVVKRWRTRWTTIVDAVCDLLASPEECSSTYFTRLKSAVQRAPLPALPKRLLGRPMQLPSGLRSQDLSHFDGLALAECLASHGMNRESPVVVIGPRTMGAYLAPLVKAKLLNLGWAKVSWCTVRPKRGISPWERADFKALRSPRIQVVVADESPNTGKTYLLILKLLRELGVQPERIILLAAMHPTRPDWRLPVGKETCGVTLIRLEANDLFKNRYLEPQAAGSLIREYFQARGWRNVQVTQSTATQKLNAQLDQHFEDGFQCRLKRVFDVSITKEDQAPIHTRVLAKSVGWGWLGYHAYFAGKRLEGFVPEALGLRHGVLFTEWLETSEQNVSAQPRRPSLEGLAQYVAARVGKLQLTRDPVLEICLEYGGTGWTALILTLRNAYGPLVGRLKSPAIRQRLARYIAPSPTMVDGQMKPEDWLLTTGGYRKVDFEHHNFGRTELYIVDPAYDLACASFEFGLSEREEEELVTWYVQASEDSSVLDRLLLWKLLYGTVVLTQARAVMQKETRSEVVERWHRRSFGARNFLVYQMNLFCGGLLPDLVGTGWTRRLVFLDLDGVFDTEFFGFPQTTTSGLLALALLQAHGYSVLLNTARSIKDVRQYCKAYRLPGGVAETGCVFYDAIQDREVSLVDPESAEQLDRCREALRSFPGVFIDPNYRLAIRVFVPSGDRTVGLPSQHVSGLLEHLKLDRLTFIPTSVDTTILPRGIGKASGLSWAREYLHASGEPIVAFGDSDQDIEMLLLADRAFAPSNCSKALRELSASHRIKRVRSSTQRGLLEAALLVVHPDGSACIQCRVKLTPPKGCGELIRDLMRAHELSRIRRYVSILDWRGI